MPRIQTMPWVLLPLADPPFPPPLAQLGVSALPWFQRRPQQLTRPHPQRLGSEIEVPKGRQRPAERRRHGNAAGSGASSAAQSRQNLQLLRVGRRGGAGGGPPRSGAGSSPEMSPARESPRRPSFPSFLRDLCIPVPSCRTQDPFPQARPLPDVGAAQGESQQVERSAAHAQADEADHRDELREDRKNFLSGTAPSRSPFTGFSVRPTLTPPHPRSGAASLWGERTFSLPPHVLPWCPSTYS